MSLLPAPVEPAARERVAQTLTALDRCDACGARAYVKAILEVSGKDLLFCAHHWHKHSEKLQPQLAGWIDETDWLNPSTTPPAD